MPSPDPYHDERPVYHPTALGSKNGLDNSCSSWKSIIDLPMADALLSTCWFPYSSSSDPSRYCFVVAVKDHPIHLLDATDGRIRASYPIIDHRELMVAPHSMLFSDDGSTQAISFYTWSFIACRRNSRQSSVLYPRLYAGYDTAIEIFDVSRPGEAGERYKTLSSRKSRDGQKGILSTLASDPAREGFLAAGSLSGQIGLHDTLSNDIRPAITFHSVENTGVTQIKFHPLNTQVLFSASRKSNQITCWDLRYGATSFHSFHRPGRTSQKIGFDIDSFGLNLITGATDGKMRLYRLDDIGKPAECYRIHSDTIPTAAFSPTACTIITCAGSRRQVHSHSWPSTAAKPPTPSRTILDENVEDSGSDSENRLDSYNESPRTSAGQALSYGDPASRRSISTELDLWKFSYR